MTALRTAPIFTRIRRPAPPRFEIGDRVRVDAHEAEGLIVGVRYGAPAYDVTVNGTCLRNLPPGRIRLADAQGPAAVVPLRRVAAELPDFVF